MSKPTPIIHPRMTHAPKSAQVTEFPAGPRTKKPPAKDKSHLWESAFHAERGCLSCGLGPKHPAPVLHH